MFGLSAAALLASQDLLISNRWIAEKWGDNVQMSRPKEGKGGTECFKISCTGTPRQSQWMENVTGLKPYSTYRVTGYVKTEGISEGGAGFVIYDGKTDAHPVATGTTDWHPFTFQVRTDGVDSIRLACFLGVDRPATGTAWFDDVKLEETSVDRLAPSVTLVPSKPRAPISPYIYGQFIEHLGRSINLSGIWSEMIDDRKFYFPIEPGQTEPDGKPFKQKSPWSAAGGAKVSQSTQHPFVGRWSPSVEVSQPNGGIAQGKIGVRSDVDTVGYVWLEGPTGATINVGLAWGEGTANQSNRRIVLKGSGFQKYPLQFRSGTTTEAATLSITAATPVTFRIGTVSLMPGDNVDGVRKDVLALLKRLNSPAYRWPGGCFVGGYDWRTGLGDRDHRAPFSNTFWTGIECNDFGLHEFMKLCRTLHTEPYVCVDTGPGTAKLAADQVRYCNDPVTTEMGQWRAKNGDPKPFNVKFWAVGNEMFGDWEPGHMPLEKYVKKHNEVADAMRAADPKAVLVGVGEAGPWSETMLRESGDHMQLMSEHFYKQDWHSGGLMTHVNQIPTEIRRRVDEHRGYRDRIPGLAKKDIRIAMDEWNYWYGPHVYGELGTVYYMKDALGIAAGLHEYYRQSDIVYMANYAQTVNVIGAIKTSRVAADMETTGLVLEMYRKYFGEIPFEVTGDFRPLDVVAAWSKDHRTITIGVVNPTTETQHLKLNGLTNGKTGVLHGIGGLSPTAHNDPAHPNVVTPWEKPYSGGDLEVPSASAVILVVRVKG